MLEVDVCVRHLRDVPSKVAEKLVIIFTALHGMQTRSSDENSVRLSVRLSNK